MKHKIICGKSEIELKQFDDNFFDSCVTDPPYGLEFMGKDWDKFNISESRAAYLSSTRKQDCDYKLKGEGRYSDMTLKEKNVFQQFTYEWATELYRVMKPGAHILIFGGTRTYHRMACAVEDAGFECRDMIEWFYGSGFPKSLNISKQLDKMAGTEKIIGKGKAGKTALGQSSNWNKTYNPHEFNITEPNSSEAIQWNGWGTGMKPAHGPILLARKPISEKNIASNVLKYGTSGLNIDECRIGYQNNQDKESAKVGFNGVGWKHSGNTKEEMTPLENDLANQQGRFPANLILDDDAGEMLDEQSGELTTGEMNSTAKGGQFGTYGYQYPRKTISHKSKGGASRFFYQAKASQNERWFYCTICKQAYPMKERDNHIHNAPEKTKYKYLEFHPTQKPEALITYLARLITPPNGTMLDLFLGSGTGLIAAEREGFNATGIDSKREYCLICHQRLKSEIEQIQTKLTGEQSKIDRKGF